MSAFHPFDPRSARRLFWIGAFACAGLCAWAIQGARRGSERDGEARAGVCAGLALAFAYGGTRLRPREGWGVTLGPEALHLSRPLGPGGLEIPWWAVANVRMEGPTRVVIFIHPEPGAPGSAAAPEASSDAENPASPRSGALRDTRVRVARHLFASDAAFAALVEALRSRVPERRLDA